MPSLLPAASAFSGMRSGVRRAARGMLDLLYPPRCLACDARLPAGHDPLCAACLTGMAPARTETVAERLRALPEDGGQALDSAFALWRFDPDGALRVLQHAIKYGNRPRYGVAAGRWMGDALRRALPQEQTGREEIDAVVPVPLHYTRRLERSYNQSTQLARGLAERLAVPCRPGWLARPRPTRSQTRLSRRARWENVSGAFVASGPLDDGRLLLVDDVLTTGATAAAAARTLRQSGAGAVHLATLALAD